MSRVLIPARVNLVSMGAAAQTSFEAGSTQYKSPVSATKYINPPTSTGAEAVT